MIPAVEAFLLGKAVFLLGSPAKLAARLKVEEYVVLVWLSGHASVPSRVLRSVVDMILEAERAKRRERRSAKEERRVRHRRHSLT